MSNNIRQGKQSYGNFTPIAPADFVVAGGANGWIDTDITASCPTAARLCYFKVYAAANQNAGARAPGDSTDTKYNNVGVCWEDIFAIPINSHVELYRSAANNTYKLMGYFL